MAALYKQLLGLFCLSFASIAQSQPAVHPNILLLMAEDMSARVGAFGDNVAVTPNLDALAADGVRYANTFTTAGVCAPSRAAHILGMHQMSTGTQHMRSSTRPGGSYYSVPPDGVKAYPELLRAAGYYTYTDNKLDYQFSGSFRNSGPTTIWDEEGADATEWHNRRVDQPFFGFINFMVTHESGVFRPLGSMPESVTHFVTQLLRWWVNDGPVPEIVAPSEVPVPPYYPDTPTVRADIARHYNNIAFMDQQVGEILAQLEADGLADSTIVIWTTDHGDGLPRAKRDLYDSGIRVPMIIRWPAAFRPDGVAPGAVDERLISFVDLGPTILTLAGVAVPATMQGRNFVGHNAQLREYVYAARDRIDEIMDRQRAVRDSRYKYLRSWYPQTPEGSDIAFRSNVDMVRELRRLYDAGQLNDVQQLWYEPPGAERLYDLQEDPFEINNLVDDPQYQTTLQRMRGAMDEWLARVGDGSEEPEDTMVARIESDGERRVTAPPAVAVTAGLLIITPAAPGHSLEYRLGDGPWRLYTAPVRIAPDVTVEARAVRYGWEESEVVSGS